MNYEFEGMPFEDLSPNVAPAGEGSKELSPANRRSRRECAYVDLTDELVASARCDTSEAFVFDLKNPRLALRLRGSGHKSWYLLAPAERSTYPDDPIRSARRKFLGDVGTFSVADARKKAEWERQDLSIIKRQRRLRGDLRVSAVVSEYFKDHSPEHQEWFATVQSLFGQYLLPKYRTRTLSAIRKAQWIEMIEVASLHQVSRGRNLLKALRAFLSWAVARGVIDANPLLRLKLDLPSARTMVYLAEADLAQIYEAAQSIEKPWSVMLALVILTGEAMEDVRQLQRGDIDWSSETWTVEWAEDFLYGRSPIRTIHLSQEALRLLAPFRSANGYFFPSNGAHFWPKPINFYSEVIDRLNEIAGTRRKWGLRDCRQGAFHAISRRGEGKCALDHWSKELIARLRERRSKKENPEDCVVI